MNSAVIYYVLGNGYSRFKAFIVICAVKKHVSLYN